MLFVWASLMTLCLVTAQEFPVGTGSSGWSDTCRTKGGLIYICGWRMASGGGLGEGRVIIMTTPKLGSRGNNVQPTDRCESCMCWKGICKQWK